jgi:hypothetical protein
MNIKRSFNIKIAVYLIEKWLDCFADELLWIDIILFASLLIEIACDHDSVVILKLS